MKKFKKLFAVILSLAMVLGMSMTAFAADEEETAEISPVAGGKIVVNNLTMPVGDGAKVTVEAYNVYTFDKTSNSWVVSDWAKSIEGISPETLNNPEVVSALAAAAKNQTTTLTAQAENGTATIETGINAGAYLVIATDSTNKTTYSPMVAITYDYSNNNLMTAATATVIAKAENYTVDKELNDNDNVVAVGDIVTYTITTSVPYVTTTKGTDTDGNETTTMSPTEFKITDTLVGADYYLSGTGSTLTGTVGTSPIQNLSSAINPTDTTVTVEGQTVAAKTFTLDLSSYLNNNANAGKTVTITYSAKVNAVDTVTNTAKSNVAKDENGGEKTITTTANTGSMKITKKGEVASNGQRPVLSGAQFALYRLQEDGRTKEYAKISNGYITGEWSTTFTESGMTVTTDQNGEATVKGLGAGTYYFEEKKAPEGYSLNETDTPSATISKDNLVVTDLEMNDTKLSSLPSTGGIGTTIFTIGGCVIMIAAAALFFANRRRAAK